MFLGSKYKMDWLSTGGIPWVIGEKVLSAT